MGLETGTKISDLVSTNPLVTDPRSEGDDHIRLLKAVIKADAFSRDAVHTAVDKVTQVNADEFVMMDSAASFTPKRTTWASIKATLKTYFDGLYMALVGNQTVGGVKTFTNGVTLGAASDLGTPSALVGTNITGTAADLNALATSGRLIALTKITATNAAWTPNASTTKIVAYIVNGGGGGGSGGGNYGYGGGGGGGSHTGRFVYTSTVAGSYSITIGAGGAGGIGASHTSGSSGGLSSFTDSNLVVTGGGTVGANGSGGGGAGGAGGVGVTSPYGAGGTAGAGSVTTGGNGGAAAANSAAGGGGGGGGGEFYNGGNGGAGGSGFVYIWEYA